VSPRVGARKGAHEVLHQVRENMKRLGAALVLLLSIYALAEDKIQGTISADAQKVTLTHGVAAIDKKGSVSVRLLGAVPSAREEARALAESGEISGVFAAPNALVELSFKSGATRADLASFESCHVGFHEFQAGLFDWSGFSKQCGVTELSGDLKPGGVVHGKLKGQAQGYPPQSGPAPVYTWDVDFTATLRAKP
jgi:hypothetical protein